MDFFGEIQEVTTDKAQYRPGEAVKLRIKSWARVVGNGKYCEGSWNTIYAVRDYFTGVLLASDVRNHTIAYWTAEDYAEDDFWLPIGKAPAETTWVEVVMSAKNDITVDFTPYLKQITVAGAPAWPDADIRDLALLIGAGTIPDWPEADIKDISLTIGGIAWPEADIKDISLVIGAGITPPGEGEFKELTVSYKGK